MVERPIHNLKVAGSNPEVGNIFSERYQRKEVQGVRESTTVALEKRERYGSMKLLFYFRNYVFLNFQLKTRKFAAKNHRYYIFSVVIYAHLICKCYECQSCKSY